MTANNLLTHKKFLLSVWVALLAAILGVDYITGPSIRFPVLFVFPVTLAAYFHGWFYGICFAVLSPVIRVALMRNQSFAITPKELLINEILQIITFAAFAVLVDYAANQQRKVRILRGLLPICSFCKRIRKPDGSWEQLESFITKQSEASFTHGLCEHCAETKYGVCLSKAGND